MNDYLTKTTENNELQKSPLQRQIDREEQATECANFKIRKCQAEAEKAELELKKAKIDVDLAESLKAIAVQKAQQLANLEVDAQRKRLGL